MKSLLKQLRLGTAVVATLALLAGVSSTSIALAQTASPAPAASVALSEPTIKALQEALNKQGIAVKTDGVLNNETRAAIRKYQSQHHLPVTGEPDKATLDKLGVRLSATTAQSPTLAQATPTPPAGSPPPQAQTPTPPAPTQPGQTPSGMMMNCPMMQGQMQGQMQAMMQMMQGMMQMMQMMQGPMQPGPMQPGQMQPGPMRPMPMQPGAR